jgi:hypothetical protein
MAFRDFTFPQVLHELGLRADDADLFSAIPPVPVHEPTAAYVRDGATLAMAVSTEKAESEFIIAPVLFELRRSQGNRIQLFSGVEWDFDSSRGLNGDCDFLLTRGGSQHILRAPFLIVVEAKNDLTRSGLGQCIAAMYAARLANEADGTGLSTVHGVVSTGVAWLFLRFSGDLVTIDGREYYVTDLPKVMGILSHIVSSADPGTAAA